MDKKGIVTINTPIGAFDVPIPTIQTIPKYQKVLNNTAAASIKTLHDTLLIDRNEVDVHQTAKRIKQMC